MFHTGLAQGMVTGMRGLCNGLGPAVFGLIFYVFHVDLNEDEAKLNMVDQMTSVSKKGQVPPHNVEFTNGTIALEIPHQHPQHPQQLLGDVRT